ncbi:MAG: type I polyketide synthase [Planctomycetota bacterium]
MAQISDRLAALSPAKRKLLQAKLAEKPKSASPIAVIGMACKFPGSPNLSDFWDLIQSGENRFAEVTPDRWPVENLYDPDTENPGRASAKWACLLDDLDHFDPQFFGIAPREASRMDPQQRMLLQCAWQAMEHASVDPQALAKSPVGVFIGVGQVDYLRAMGIYDNSMYHLDAHVGTGASLSIAANRLSYVLNFTGPSMAIDTACSSALVAVDQAMTSLRLGQCNAALVGGVNVCIQPDAFISLSKARMLSPTGRCRPFDESANGYVRGEGCGVVLLKRLDDAKRDGDRVLAILRGSATNHGGRTSGITAPSGEAQQRVIQSALKDAGVSPEQVRYIEAHGTGTPLGDPIEIEALGKVFNDRTQSDPLYVTSVKANIGHTEIAAGIAGLIKTIMVMQKQMIPPQAGLDNFNPHLKFDSSRIVIPRDMIQLETENNSCFAGVSSFGFGGTNSHVVLECPAASKSTAVASSNGQSIGHANGHINDVAQPEALKRASLPSMLAISAPTSSGLRMTAEKTAAFLRDSQLELADICSTAATGRSHLEHRAVIIADDRITLAERLSQLGQSDSKNSGALSRREGFSIGRRSSATNPCVAMLMTGQGSQYGGMGMGLYDAYPEFARAMDQCEEIVQDLRGESLLDVLRGVTSDGQDNHTAIDQTEWTQPSLFALEYSAARLWQHFGVHPDVLIGHSVGEYVCATIADVMDLKSAMRLICRRGELMQSLPPGGTMAAVMTSRDRIEEMLADHPEVDIAAFNGPENTSIAGPTEAINGFIQAAEKLEIPTKALTVSHAFHSRLMSPILDDFRAYAASLEYHAPSIPIIANGTGKVQYDAIFDADYWTEHIRNPVRFAESASCLTSQRVNMTVEVGPSSALTSMTRRCVNDPIESVTTVKRTRDERLFFAEALGKAHTIGASVDWNAIVKGKRVELPGYPFQQESFWFRPDHATNRFSEFVTEVSHITPMLGSRRDHPRDLVFESRISDKLPNHLRDHQVLGDIVIPGSVYVDIALAVGRYVFGENESGETIKAVEAVLKDMEEDGGHPDDQASFCVENLKIHQALFASNRPRSLQTIVAGEGENRRNLSVYSRFADPDDDNEAWTLHATATIVRGEIQRPSIIDLPAAKATQVVSLDRPGFYDVVMERGLAYGPQFQMIDGMYRGDEQVVCDVSFDEPVQEKAKRYAMHPAVGDGCMQAMVGAIPLEEDGSFCPDLYLPVSVGRVTTFEQGFIPTRFHVQRTSDMTEPSPPWVEAVVSFCDESGRVLAQCENVRVQKVAQAKEEATDVFERWLYNLEWQPLEPPHAEQEAAPCPKKVLLLGNQALAKQVNSIHAPSTWIDLQNVPEIWLPQLDAWIKTLEDTDQAEIIWAEGVHLEFDANDQDNSLTRGEAAWTSLFEFLNAIAHRELPEKCGIWIPTFGAFSVTPEDIVDPIQSGVVGLAQVASQELRGKNVRIIDLEREEEDIATLDSLVSEITMRQEGPAGILRRDERIVAYRNGSPQIPRLIATPNLVGGPKLAREIPKGERFRTRLSGDNTLDSLRFEAIDAPELIGDDVEVAVRACGLNFSDVLKALGLYPGITDDVVPLGLEVSGIVTRVGPDAKRLQVGDEVLGVVAYGFASHCVTKEVNFVRKPANLDHHEAAALPVAHLTAYYCLIKVARLEPGEIVLVHAGAGGVGLAAIDIALHRGARVFATAGSPAKRQLLIDAGVEHVFDSRTLSFAEEISEITDGRGVDIVLNSLPGEAIDKSLGCLAAYGRFVEIGKSDIYSNRPIGLEPFQDNLSYSAVDLDRLFRQRPEQARAMLEELLEHFADDHYRPPVCTVFAADDLAGAFRHMSQRKNIGKIVVDMVGHQQWSETTQPPESELDANDEVQSSQDGGRVIRGDGTYVISGGLGALGMATAEMLANENAGGLILLSRRSPDEEAAQRIENWRARGVRVETIAADVTDTDALKHGFADVAESMPPIRGVLHAAGILRDESLAKMTTEDFKAVLPAKTRGSLALVEAARQTVNSELDFVVLYSSISSVLATNGQCNYGTANAFLDGYAMRFNGESTRVIAINFGAFEGSGMAADLKERMSSQGVELLPIQETIERLPDLIQSDASRASIFRGDWNRFGMLLDKTMTGQLRYSLIDELISGDESDGADEGHLRRELEGLSGDELKTRLVEYFKEVLSDIMGINPDDLHTGTSLTALGMDSLMALELGNKMESALQIELPMSIYLQGPTIDKLATFAVEALDA